MKSIIEIFLGTETSIGNWIFAAFLAALGFFLFKLILYVRRSDKSTSFNPIYWWRDNQVEFMIGVIIFYIVVRFFKYLIVYANKTLDYFLIKIEIPEDANMHLVVFFIGLLFTLILKKLRKILGYREPVYDSGLQRKHVGSRPDDR